jgi:hypothetical protein
MSGLRKPLSSVLLITALAVVMTGCGEAKQPELGVTAFDVQLENRTFAESQSKKIEVPAGSLLLVKLLAGEGGPFRVGVVSTSSAQTVKLRSGESKTLSLNAMNDGQSVRLLSGRNKIQITARGRP